VHEELQEAFALLKSQPGIGALAINTRGREIRRLHLSRIHYYIFYRVRANTAEIIALWHTSRGSDPNV
jgi:plasmid stabilization system protein ParE